MHIVDRDECVPLCYRTKLQKKMYNMSLYTLQNAERERESFYFADNGVNCDF